MAAATAETARILLVDDDAATRELTAALLTQAGHEPLSLGPDAATDMLDFPGEFDAIVVDAATPSARSAKLFDVIGSRPDLSMPVIVLATPLSHPRLALGDCPGERLQSPYSLDHLLAAVDRGVERAAAERARREEMRQRAQEAYGVIADLRERVSHEDGDRRKRRPRR